MKEFITVNILIIDDKQRILLVKRAKGLDAENLWSLPGGTSQIDENLEDTLKREIKEELGCVISSFSFFRSYKILTSEKLVNANYFFGTIKSPIDINKEELSEYNWFERLDIPTTLAFNQNEVLDEFWKNYYK